MQQIHLLLPVPPVLERALWYNEDRRYIGIYWDCLFDDCIVADGRCDHVGSGRAWKAFVGHPRVARGLAQYQFGSDQSHPEHMLLLDRNLRRVFVMHYDEGEEFLRLQATEAGPVTVAPQPVRRPTLSLVGKPAPTLERALLSSNAVQDIMKMSRGLETAMISWLDER